VGKDVIGHLNITTNLVTLSPGPTALFTAKVISLVIHVNPDNETTNPSGNSGERIICGFIKEK
jgi:Cu-Zn family superoxide dismutase